MLSRNRSLRIIIKKKKKKTFIITKHLLPLFKALDAVIRSYLRHGSGEGFTKRFLNLKRLKPERLLLS